MAYFNNAATTYPKPQEVYSFMDEYNRKSGSEEGRGNTDGKLISQTRMLVKQILHCENKEVVFTPSNTIAMNMIIQGIIKAGGISNVYISPFEHNAVTRILHVYREAINIILLPVKKSLEYDLNQINYDFDNEKPDLIIISHASNVCGLIAPIEKIFACAKKHNAITVLDMAQTAGLIDIDLNSQYIDYPVFAGHKTLYGPTGVSGFICTSSSSLSPVLFGGTGVDSLNQDMPRTIPEKFEMGTHNMGGIAGLYSALKWIQSVSIAEIWKIEQRNKEKLLDILQRYDNLKIVGYNPLLESVGVISVLFDGYSSESIGEVFKKHNVTVRTGLHCAPYAHQFLGTSPGGTVRFSISYFTTDEDFEQLINILDYIEENG